MFGPSVRRGVVAQSPGRRVHAAPVVATTEAVDGVVKRVDFWPVAGFGHVGQNRPQALTTRPGRITTNHAVFGYVVGYVVVGYVVDGGNSTVAQNGNNSLIITVWSKSLQTRTIEVDNSNLLRLVRLRWQYGTLHLPVKSPSITLAASGSGAIDGPNMGCGCGAPVKAAISWLFNG